MKTPRTTMFQRTWRMIHRLPWLCLLGAVSWLGAPAQAEITGATSRNWPQWRGPLGTGIAPNASPPLTWSETSNVRWKVRIPGSGSSTPIVWENQVFVLTAIPTGKQVAATATESAEADRANAPQPGERRGGGPWRHSRSQTERSLPVCCALPGSSHRQGALAAGRPRRGPA